MKVLFKSTLILTVFLALLTLTVNAQVEDDIWAVDVGAELTKDALAPRLDMEYAYFTLPLHQGLRWVRAGAKTPSLFFDIYGIGGLTFTRYGNSLLSGWTLSYHDAFHFGVGKQISFDNLKLRLEGLIEVDQIGDTDRYLGLSLQYRFGG